MTKLHLDSVNENTPIHQTDAVAEDNLTVLAIGVERLHRATVEGVPPVQGNVARLLGEKRRNDDVYLMSGNKSPWWHAVYVPLPAQQIVVAFEVPHCSH